MRKIALVVATIVLAMSTSFVGVANATVDHSSIANGFPARVIGKWYEAHRKGFLGLPIGPPCWGVTVYQIGVTDLDGSSFCTTEAAWKAHPWGSSWEGGFPK